MRPVFEMSDSSLKPPTGSHRKRASTPRSKTGCVTCKIRRLKCGEEKPSCLRCAKSGWACDGYGHVNKPHSRPSSPPETVLVPILPRRPSPKPSPTPSFKKTLDLDDYERQYFQSFVDDVSNQLPSHDSFFWKGVALQESHTSSTVQHALVAIGALAKSTTKVLSGAHRMKAPPCHHREFALQQYQKAIQGLRQSITINDQADSMKATLISCLVLAFFDNFIGNGGYAIQHVRYAREVLCKSTQALQTSPVPREKDQDRDRIISMLLRLDMESFCAMGAEPNRKYITLQPRDPTFTFPLHFSSTEEALAMRNLVVWEGYDLFYRISRYQNTPKRQVPVEITRERDLFIGHLRTLNNLLDFFVQTSIMDFGIHPLGRAEALKLPSAVLLIRLASGLGAPEPACDNLLPEFAFLLDICRAALEYETIINPTISEGEIFSFDVRVIAALSLVATKCRSTPLRQHAINLLLSSHRREWMYDSLLAGKVAAWMLSLEVEQSASHSRKTSIASSSSVTSITSNNSIDSNFGNWFAPSIDDGEGIHDTDWIEREIASMNELVHLDDEVYEEGAEDNRAWGPIIEWDVELARTARVKCRQNFRAEDGSIGWHWKETNIRW